MYIFFEDSANNVCRRDPVAKSAKEATATTTALLCSTELSGGNTAGKFIGDPTAAYMAALATVVGYLTKKETIVNPIATFLMDIESMLLGDPSVTFDVDRKVTFVRDPKVALEH